MSLLAELAGSQKSFCQFLTNLRKNKDKITDKHPESEILFTQTV